MILVTTGTHHQPFTRLVAAMEAYAESTEEEVFIQHGLTPFAGRRAKGADFLERDALLTKVRAARVVVTHAGIGSVMDVLNARKPLVVVPRLKRFGEHNSDHQLELAGAVAKRNWGRVVLNIDELAEVCGDAPDAYEGYAPASTPLIEFVRCVVKDAATRQTRDHF